MTPDEKQAATDDQPRQVVRRRLRGQPFRVVAFRECDRWGDQAELLVLVQ